MKRRPVKLYQDLITGQYLVKTKYYESDRFTRRHKYFSKLEKAKSYYEKESRKVNELRRKVVKNNRSLRN